VVDIAEELGEAAIWRTPRPLNRIDGQRAIEAPKRIEDEPTVPLADVLARARVIRDANRDPQPETEPVA